MRYGVQSIQNAMKSFRQFQIFGLLQYAFQQLLGNVVSVTFVVNDCVVLTLCYLTIHFCLAANIGFNYSF